MLRLILAFVFVLLLAFGAAWLADLPGELVVRVGGTEISTSLLVAGVALALFAVLVVAIWRSYHMLIEAPGRIGEYVRSRGRRRGLEALARGMIAAGAGDGSTAAQEAAVAERQLGKAPLTLLLRAQTAQLKGDEREARRAYEVMLEEPDTQILGLRGLFVQARKAGDVAAARSLAERAVAINPQVEWASLALFELQSAAGDYEAALETLEARRRHRLVERREADRFAAVLRTAQAQELAESDPDAALGLALEAHRLAPELVPAAVIAGRILAEKSDPARAARVVERTWKSSPHPDLAVVYAHMRPGDSPRDRLKRVRSLAGKNSEGAEGPIAVARAALEARAFDEARRALEPLLDDQPSQRVCALMAEIEASEHGDRGRVREWLARAVNAPRDPVWTADGTVSPVWRPVSPVSGALDAFEWRVPVTGLAVQAGEALEAAGAAVPVTVMPVALTQPEAVRDDEAEAKPAAKPEIIEPEARTKPSPQAKAAAEPKPEPAKPALGAKERAAAGKEQNPDERIRIVPNHAPDDPGVPPGEEEDEDPATAAPPRGAA